MHQHLQICSLLKGYTRVRHRHLANSLTSSARSSGSDYRHDFSLSLALLVNCINCDHTITDRNDNIPKLELPHFRQSNGFFSLPRAEIDLLMKLDACTDAPSFNLDLTYLQCAKGPFEIQLNMD